MIDINAYLHKNSNVQFTQLHNDKKAWPLITNQKIVDICKEITGDEIYYLFHSHSALQNKVIKLIIIGIEIVLVENLVLVVIGQRTIM